jgi:cytochrome c biogenesis protein CcmG/thiol:disulfide interchange protein DsbE
MNYAAEPTDPTVVDNTVASETASLPHRHRLTGRWLAAFIFVAALVSYAIWQGVSTSSPTDTNVLTNRTGASATGFSLPSVSASTRVLSLNTFRGRPLVVNFWASWCVPCRTEMPLLEKAFRSERGKVAFLGIDTNDTPGAARAFLAKVHVTYPVASDPTGSVAATYGLFGLPTTIFISSTGKVIGRHIGQFTADTLSTALHEAFGN